MGHAGTFHVYVPALQPRLDCLAKSFHRSVLRRTRPAGNSRCSQTDRWHLSGDLSMESVTDLINATAGGEVSRVRQLLARGADPDERDADGWFPLLVAAVSGPRELVVTLVEAGADVNAQAPDGSTALMKATLWRHVAVVRLLLERGARVDIGDERGWTALGIAMLLEHQELIALLKHDAK